MLSRTADHLYWMSRYVERAENIARFIDVANRASLSSGNVRESAWDTVLTIAGEAEDYLKAHKTVTPVGVITYAVLSQSNLSSIYSSLRIARENAHAVRSVIPNELWEAMNSTWLELRTIDGARLRDVGLTNFCDWVRERSHTIRGITYGTMQRDEAYHFLRLGTFLERSDNTARLLSLRAKGVTAEDGGTGDQSADSLHWSSVLRSVSAYKAFRTVYRDDLTPARVAELLILRHDMPRSLHYCLDMVTEILEILAEGRECARLAGELHAQLHYGRLDHLLAQGLDVFLNKFVERNETIGSQIHSDFLMAS